MKSLFVVIVCLLMLIGCITYQPVSSMTDWQLESEHYRLQVKQSKLRSFLIYRRPLHGAALIKGTTAHKRATLKLRKVKNRIRKVEYEILKRLEMDILSM